MRPAIVQYHAETASIFTVARNRLSRLRSTTRRVSFAGLLPHARILHEGRGEAHRSLPNRQGFRLARTRKRPVRRLRAVFPPGYLANLTTSWIPALQGVEAKLRAGAKVADVGCGHGASTILMAQAYPESALLRLRLP